MTFQHVVELLLDTPAFFRVFWNSCVQVLPAVAGQVLIGAPAAWALSQLRFRGRNTIFRLYIVLMILPFQVTMASSYIVLNKLGLIDSPFAILLPAAFSAFPVFIMTKFFRRNPARDAGGGAHGRRERVGGLCSKSVCRWGCPACSPPRCSALSRAGTPWNSRLRSLKSASLTPLSVFLPATTVAKRGGVVCVRGDRAAAHGVDLSVGAAISRAGHPRFGHQGVVNVMEENNQSERAEREPIRAVRIETDRRDSDLVFRGDAGVDVSVPRGERRAQGEGLRGVYELGFAGSERQRRGQMGQRRNAVFYHVFCAADFEGVCQARPGCRGGETRCLPTMCRP